MSRARNTLKKLGVRRPGTAGRLEGQVAELRQRNKSLRERSERLAARVARLESEKKALRAQLPKEQPARTTAVAELPGLSRLDVRRKCVLADSGPDPLILEIGPAHNAILPKREGYKTRTVDYLDRAGLIERYKDFSQYDPDDIEDVDYVLAPGAAMADVITERFDLVVASHVIEHTTSMIDFLTECTKLLAPGGTLALVVPDHRYCYDRFRERASLSRVIDASLNPPPVHTMGAVIEERINASRHRNTTAWLPGHQGTYTFVHPLSSVIDSGEDARKADRYIDTHNWVATPHHLRLLVQDLHDLGFTTLREVSFHDTVRHEFFLNLSAEGPGTGLSREHLMALSDEERRSLDHAVFAD